MSINDELCSVDAFMEWVVERHPGEQEFHQAVCAVAEHCLGLARNTREFREQRVLQRMTEPDRTLSFRVVWEDDEGNLQINRGYRVQLNNSIGPYKGGLRFDPGVNQGILKFLAFEQLFKNSLTGLNIGAGKGGADFDSRHRSDSETMRFCQSFMTELFRHIGQETDVPAGDIGVGNREIGFLFGQYRRLENQFAGAMTGKSIGAGGSELRTEATGFGAIYFLCAMLNEAGESIDGKRIAVSGAGNVAMHAALKAEELGGKVITLSNRDGAIYKADGFSSSDLETINSDYRTESTLEELADRIDAEWHDGDKPWRFECDVAVPSATQNELDLDDAERLIEGSCRTVVEAANMPLTSDAEARLETAGVLIAPGKAANAGGVAVSGFEMAQNRTVARWSADRLDQELRDIMTGIFERCRDEGQSDDGIDYRRGADIAGFKRVAAAIAASGFM